MRTSSLESYLPSFSGYCLFSLYVGYLCFSPLPGFLMEGGGRDGEGEGGSLAKATAPTAGLTAHSPVTLISFFSTHLGSQDANHIPKARQTIFPPWMESNMCSPFGTKCLSSVSVTFRRRESTGFLLFCLPLLSRAAERSLPPRLWGRGGRLREGSLLQDLHRRRGDPQCLALPPSP